MANGDSILQLLQVTGFPGKLAMAACLWTVAASLCHLASSFRLLLRFRREGPVMPPLLPQLEEKWQAAHFRTRIWGWFRRAGMLCLFAALCLALLDLGLLVRELLTIPVAPQDWSHRLADLLSRVYAVGLYFLLALLCRSLCGGLAALLTVRAHNYVTASHSLVTPEDVARARRSLEQVESLLARDEQAP